MEVNSTYAFSVIRQIVLEHSAKKDNFALKNNNKLSVYMKESRIICCYLKKCMPKYWYS